MRLTRGRSDMNKTLLGYMVDILTALVDECASIPSGVMDCLITQFENAAEVSSSDDLPQKADKFRIQKVRHSSLRPACVIEWQGSCRDMFWRWVLRDAAISMTHGR
jgi:hypothetical protein